MTENIKKMKEGYEEMGEIIKESNIEENALVEDSVGDDVVLKLLLIECIRRLSKNGKHKVHITDAQLKMAIANDLELDLSGSDSNKFVVKLERNN